MIESMIFYFFSALAILASLSVVFSKNAVRGVLFLVLAFIAMAAVWMMLEAEFLAVALVLVYVGAVMVLFLFVVMMLDIELGIQKMSFKRHWPLGLLVLAVMLGLLVYAVSRQHFGSALVANPPAAPASYNNIAVLGELLYTRYLLPFEVAGTLLLVAMIAAIALAFRGKRSRYQRVETQVYTTKADRLTVLKMQAEKDAE